MQAARNPKRKSLSENSTWQITQTSTQDVPLEFISNDVPQNNTELFNGQCIINVLKTEPSFYEDEKIEEMNSNQFDTSSVQRGGQKNQVEPEYSVAFLTHSSDCSNIPHIGQLVKAEPSHQYQDELKFSLADIVAHFQSSASTQSSHVENSKEPLSRNPDLSRSTKLKKVRKPYSHDHYSNHASAERRTCAGAKPLENDLCDKSFIDSCLLFEHQRNESFRQSRELSAHKRTSSDGNSYSCDQCHKSLRTPRNLSRHNKRTHTGDKPYICTLCSKSFSSSSELVIHKRTHISEKPYRCDQCDKSFSVSGNLVRHKRTQTGEKPYSCDRCNKSFGRSWSLKDHRRTHTAEKPYSCDQCDKSFSTSGSLVVHKRTHTGEKPYSCVQCSKSFSSSGSLVKHKRTHTGEKPYSCDQCNKSFSSRRNLIRHKRTHTAEKPYSCDQCDKSFSTSGSLVVHKRTHTGEKPYSCVQCSKSFSSSGNLVKRLGRNLTVVTSVTSHSAAVET